MALGDLVVNLVAKTKRFTGPLSNASNRISRFVTSAVRGLARLSAATAVAGAGLAGFAIKLAAEAEQTEVAFATMLGSVGLAKDLMEELRGFTATTPFQVKEVNDAARALLAFGSESENLTDELRMLGDISSAVGMPIGELAEIFGKARVQGRLFGEDINQLTGRGIPIIGELAKVLGVAEGQVKKLVSEGEVGFPEMLKAFQNMTQEGGRFFGMTEAQADTIAGKWSTLKDNVTGALREIGTALIENLDLGETTGMIIEMAQSFKEDAVPAIKEFIKLAPDLVDSLNKIGSAAVKTGGFFQKGVTELQKFAFMVTAIASGMTPEEAANAFLEEFPDERGPGFRHRGPLREPPEGFDRFGRQIDEDFSDKLTDKLAEKFEPPPEMGPPAIAEKPDIPEAMRDEARELAVAMRTPAEQFADEIDRLTNLFERNLISSELFDRASQHAMETILPDEDGGESVDRNVRTLEQGTREAFEVLRANVGGKVADQQLEETKKQTQQLGQKLDKIAAAVAEKAKTTVEVRGVN